MYMQRKHIRGEYNLIRGENAQPPTKRRTCSWVELLWRWRIDGGFWNFESIIGILITLGNWWFRMRNWAKIKPQCCKKIITYCHRRLETDCQQLCNKVLMLVICGVWILPPPPPDQFCSSLCLWTQLFLFIFINAESKNCACVNINWIYCMQY